MAVLALENWLWEVAYVIRELLDAPKFKDYILPLILLKRLSDVFDDEIAQLTREFGDHKTVAIRVEQDHKLVCTTAYRPKLAFCILEYLS